MWRETWETSPLIAGSVHRFLIFLGRFMDHAGRFHWTSIKVVIRQYGFVNGRAYSSRWIEKLLACAVASGWLRRVIRSAPGQPAVYQAVIPAHPGYRPVKIRRRGIRPRRLLAWWRNEGVEPPMPRYRSGKGRGRNLYPRHLRQTQEASGDELGPRASRLRKPMMRSRHDTVCSA